MEKGKKMRKNVEDKKKAFISTPYAKLSFKLLFKTALDAKPLNGILHVTDVTALLYYAHSMKTGKIPLLLLAS